MFSSFPRIRLFASLQFSVLSSQLNLSVRQSLVLEAFTDH
jgi:hypothetical protein